MLYVFLAFLIWALACVCTFAQSKTVLLLILSIDVCLMNVLLYRKRLSVWYLVTSLPYTDGRRAVSNEGEIFYILIRLNLILVRL